MRVHLEGVNGVVSSGGSEVVFRALRAGDSPRRVGESAVMRAFVEVLDRVAAGDATVAVEGERGSGRRNAADRIHLRSARAQGPLIELNGRAAVASGDAAGALEDASKAAAGGSLIVRHAASLSARELRCADPLDARLLLLVAPGEAERAAHGHGVVSVRVPPLRQRREDIPLLLEALLAPYGERAPALTADALRRLSEYRWPGNVAELSAVARLLALRHPDGAVDVAALDATLLPAGAPLSLADLERQHILGILASCDGNRTQAARLLGISPRTLYNRLRRYHGGDGEQDAAERRSGQPS